jgi:hypothetical protein
MKHWGEKNICEKLYFGVYVAGSLSVCKIQFLVFITKFIDTAFNMVRRRSGFQLLLWDVFQADQSSGNPRFYRLRDAIGSARYQWHDLSDTERDEYVI